MMGVDSCIPIDSYVILSLLEIKAKVYITIQQQSLIAFTRRIELNGALAVVDSTYPTYLAWLISGVISHSAPPWFDR